MTNALKPRKTLHLIIYIALLSFLPLKGKAQTSFADSYNATFISMSEGLPHNFIDDLYKDSEGFLWIAMQGGGLSRYDGYGFVNFQQDTSANSLKSNFVCKVTEDRFGRLWVASEGGIDVIDLNTRQILPLLHNHPQTDSLSAQNTLTVVCDAEGCIWTANESSISRISLDAQGNIDSVLSLQNPTPGERHIVLKDLDGNGRPWAGMGGQVYQIGINPQGKLHATSVACNLHLIPGIFFTDLIKKENEVWIATSKGLFRYNPLKNALKHYEHQPKNNRSLSQNQITALALTNDSELIAATLKGLNIYDPLNDDFEHIESASAENGSNLLNNNFVNCIMADSNHIWIGTESGGISKLTPKRLSMHLYRHNRKDPQSLSPNPVNVIFEDNEHVLWVGTVEGGLNRKEPGSEIFTHYTAEEGILTHNSVSALATDGEGRLWVGTWGKGITLLNRKQPRRRIGTIPRFDDDSPTLIDFVGALVYDSLNNGMWIGTNQGIFFYDLLQKKTYSPLDSCDARGCVGAAIDHEGKLWMGSLEGVYVIDLHRRKATPKGLSFAYRHLKYKLDNPESKMIEKITCIYPATDGTLWLGSNGCGFYKRVTDDTGRERFVAYTTRNGLANNSVRSILEDHKGCLWIATNFGLSRFIIAQERFINYTLQDGLTSGQFYWNAACRTTDDLLYFGNLDGMVAIDSNLPAEAPMHGSLRFTRLCIENEEILPGSELLPQDIAVTDCIRIHESKQSFSVEFSALDFAPCSDACYSYRLEGFDKKWTQVSAGRNLATYTNLSPGTYTLCVKYTVGEVEVADRAELKIVILPYFYKTGWFIALVVVAAAFGIWQIYQLRIRNLKRRSELLHRKVEQRTRELNRQKQLLEQQTEELSRQNQILTQQNEKITRQKAQLTKMTNKIRELTFDRIAFFTNITHEFRTPITLIIGPIERALKLSYNPQVIEQLHFVERNSKYLLSLVNQLMDFRKVESGKMEITRNRHNFMEFINELITPFVIFAQERDISIKLLTRISTPVFSYDEEAMHKVLSNLLSNAIKFTPNGGSIRLYAAQLHSEKEKKEGTSSTLYLCVNDTGNGIPESDINKIFNRFYQSQGQVSYPMYGQSGSGIGLYLCRRIVQMQGGEIYARNNKRAGCSVRILLPLTEEDTRIPMPPVAPAPGLPAPTHEPATDSKKSDIHILVVEDNPDMRSFIRSILEEKYTVHEAADGNEALHMLSTQKIDFIVCDLMMPNMDGIELSRRVRGNVATAHIPFLMLTAKTAEKARIESYQVGVDGYLLKPFDEDLLLARIENILENRKRNRREYAITPDFDSMNIQAENGDKALINHAMEVMKENYKNPQFDVNDFCEAMSGSRTQINRKLRTLIGMPVSQFIRTYRLKLARQLILAQEGKGKNVADIAYEVGFNDPKYFSRCFQKEYGIKPSDMMTQINNGNDAINAFGEEDETDRKPSEE